MKETNVTKGILSVLVGCFHLINEAATIPVYVSHVSHVTSGIFQNVKETGIGSDVKIALEIK
jgi:predicted cation transporter